MIAGQVPVHAIELEPGENGDKILGEIERISSNSPDGTLVLVDVFGGTPFNASMQLMRGPSVECVSGVNLPMLLEVAMALQGGTADSLDALARMAAESGKNGIKNARESLSPAGGR